MNAICTLPETKQTALEGIYEARARLSDDLPINERVQAIANFYNIMKTTSPYLEPDAFDNHLSLSNEDVLTKSDILNVLGQLKEVTIPGHMFCLGVVARPEKITRQIFMEEKKTKGENLKSKGKQIGRIHLEGSLKEPQKKHKKDKYVPHNKKKNHKHKEELEWVPKNSNKDTKLKGLSLTPQLTNDTLLRTAIQNTMPTVNGEKSNRMVKANSVLDSVIPAQARDGIVSSCRPGAISSLPFTDGKPAHIASSTLHVMRTYAVTLTNPYEVILWAPAYAGTLGPYSGLAQFSLTGASVVTSASVGTG